MYPEIWFELGNYSHQNFLIQFPDFKSGIIDFCRDLPADQVNELYLFIDRVLEANYDGDKLAEIWEDSGAQILFEAQSAEAAFEVTKAALKKCRLDDT